MTLFIVLWNKPYLPLFWRIIVPILSAIFIPLISYLGMRFIETGVAIFRSFTPLFWSLSPFASSEKHQVINHSFPFFHFLFTHHYENSF